MPRYFFDVHDGETFTPDNEGIELPGINEAEAEAVSALSTISRDVLPDGKHRVFVVGVRDQEGRIVLRAKLSLDVERIDLPPPPTSPPWAS